jgi:DNA-binding IclR family transcriptional regulator
MATSFSDNGTPPAGADKSIGKSDGAGVIRTVRLLTSFSKDRHTLTARELSEAAGIPLPSVYRYIASLKEEALLVDDEQGGYHLSPRFIELARAAEAAESIIELADGPMHQLSAVTGETVLLVRLVNESAVCVHRIESTQALRISIEPGQTLPLELGASAKVLLASMKPERLRARLEALRVLHPERAATVEKEVAEASRRGWATRTSEDDTQDIDPGVWVASAAVRDGSNIVAALTIASPLARATEAVRMTLLAEVLQTAGKLSAALTYKSIAPS